MMPPQGGGAGARGRTAAPAETGDHKVRPNGRTGKWRHRHSRLAARRRPAGERAEGPDARRSVRVRALGAGRGRSSAARDYQTTSKTTVLKLEQVWLPA